MSCDDCPCPDVCLGWAPFCAWAAEKPPDEIRLKHICARSRMGERPERPMPSLVTQAVNLAGAVGRVVTAVATGQAVAVDAAEQARRLELCRACEYFQSSPGRCKLCGCVANLKARLATEHCPIGKW